MVKGGCEWQDKCKRDVLAEVGSKHGIEGRRIAFVQGHDLYGSWCGSLFLRKRGGCGQKPERQRGDEQRCQKAYGHESHCGCPSQKCARIVRLLRLLSRAGKPAIVATNSRATENPPRRRWNQVHWVIDRYRGLKIENTDRGSRWRM